MAAREQHGAIRREVPDGVRVVLEGLPEAHRLLFQDLQVVPVEDLRLLDPAQLQIRVEGDVKVNDLVDEPLDAEIMDEELDLDDVLLQAFRIVGHDRHGARSRLCNEQPVAIPEQEGRTRGANPALCRVDDADRSAGASARYAVAVVVAIALVASPCSHLVVTDFGRVIGNPIARAMTACAQTPRARDTLNSTV